MTGVHELRTVQVISAAPETVRVSVLGGRTQVDVALPTDVPVAGFLPELAQLIGSRSAGRDEEVAARDERRTYWVLSRVSGGEDLAPEDTLREAGVADGQLLRLVQRRALSPPMLFDDVVDAAARLNRASYAAWDATSAGVMGIAGLWAASATWIYFLVTPALLTHRSVVIGGAVLTVVTMVGGAALVRRALGRRDLAAAAGVPVVALSAAIGWTVSQPHDEFVRAGTCAVLLVLTVLCHRLIGAGRWAYLAGAVVYAFTAVALLARAFGGGDEVVATATAVVATLGCLAVRPLSQRLRRRDAVVSAAVRRDPLASPVEHSDSGEDMPSAEEVWARVRAASLTRAGLLAGLALVAATAAVLLVRVVPLWAALVFALICAAVLALHGRRVDTAAEGVALVVPATALVLIACVQVQAHSPALRLAGIVVLVITAVAAGIGGLIVAQRRAPRWAPTCWAYLEYFTVAALIPVALWPLGIYDRLGW